MTAEFYKFILVTHRQNQSLADYLQFIEICISSGVTSVQLREKNAKPCFLLAYARQLKALLDRYQIPLLINDNLELALEINAQGVHLGQTDLAPELARERLSHHKWIGLSIETEEDLRRANKVAVDYVAASAVFPTEHKANICTHWGLDGLHTLAQSSRHPVIAIGGINQQNIDEVMAAGAKGIAVIGALHQAKDPAAMALRLRELIDSRSKNDHS